MFRYYALHDSDINEKKKGAIEIDFKIAEDLNNDGWGIFWTFNTYENRRRAINIKKINYWACDIDEGSKEEQLERINSLILKPTMIIESKKGYHCYWQSENATLENYREITQGIIAKLNADKHCTDPVRLLRVPYFYHMKDKNNPFLIQVIEENNKIYTEEKMLYAYQLPKKKLKQIKYDGDNKDFLDDKKWQTIFKINEIGEGCRNSMLARYVFWLKDLGFNNEISYIINGINQKLYKPLEQWEIDVMLKTKGVQP